MKKVLCFVFVIGLVLGYITPNVAAKTVLENKEFDVFFSIGSIAIVTVSVPEGGLDFGEVSYGDEKEVVGIVKVSHNYNNNLEVQFSAESLDKNIFGSDWNGWNGPIQYHFKIPEKNETGFHPGGSNIGSIPQGLSEINFKATFNTNRVNANDWIEIPTGEYSNTITVTVSTY